MASGKSSVGKNLSKKLSMSFIDLDEYIIEKKKNGHFQTFLM
jgi:shikimate kinase